jgi:glycosyltransferase involved in cell wall biosynthesis
MRKLRILVYGDIDLNIMDGSAVWLTSLANVLNQDENIRADVLLKAPIRKNHLIKDISHLEQINVIDTFSYFKRERFQDWNRMTVKEAVEVMEKLDEENHYHCIFVRGLNLVKQLLNSSLAPRTIPYITDFTHDKQKIKQDEVEVLKEIYQAFPHMFVQTKEMGETLGEIIEVSGDKFQLLSPMIPDYEEVPAFKNQNFALAYTGKFAADWYTEEILDAYEKVAAKDKSIRLNLAGDKFQGELSKRKKEFISRFNEWQAIHWAGAVSRKESNQLIKESDIGIAWRSEQVDNDESVELSTKLLEYGREGKPILLRRTRIHEQLLGKDYPLFVENEQEFVEKTLEIFADRKLYRSVAKTVHEACKPFTFKEVYKAIKPILWSFHHEKIKIVFAGHDLKFIQMALEYFQHHPDYDVRIDKWEGHDKHDEAFSKECSEWADVVFCEWGLGNAVFYSHHKKKGQRVVVRMHLQERETVFPAQYQLNNIDQIIAISPYIYEEFHRTCKIPREKMVMIYNMIDTQKFNKPKLNDEQVKFNLGVCGILPSRKRLDKALNILEALWQKNPRYTLYIKSRLPQELPWLRRRKEENDYYEAVFERINQAPWKNNVIFDQHGSDMEEWFRKIGYCLSTSDFESFHLAPMEGMASGSLPVVLHWKGAETIYPKEFLFEEEEQAAAFIQEQAAVPSRRDDLREYPLASFDRHMITEKLEECILSLM